MSIVIPKFGKVMVIDDNNIDLYITSRMILKNHFALELLQYYTATEALEYLSQNQDNATAWPDIIFTDLYMPIMSGFEFMESFSRLPGALKAHCRTFVLSSSIDDNDIIRAANDENIEDFHEKPITVKFLENINPRSISS